ncbi:protein sprouty homolog 2-like [Watersipora subatra]|uniref:protein sprouty homolog 2-like n=1 Tax=Watersipora subatra TaxID=2589382 RepID=UPI00355B3DC6
MDEDSTPPPPLPDRPGRVVRIQGIDSIRSESTPNEYVDTNTISTSQKPPQRPAKQHKPDKPVLKSKVNHIKNMEHRENVRNEIREQLQGCKKEPSCTKSLQSPKVPPRSERPPPVPPRDRRVVCSDRLPSRPAVTRSNSNQPSWKCNTSPSRLENSSSSLSKSKSLLPATVLIITEESRFPQFSTRSLRRDKGVKDSPTNAPQPVTQQPAASNIMLTLGETGNISNSIICRECGQCRCTDCTGQRKLPERWLCEGNCRCSADSVVDVLSCMCCVKSCFKTIIDNPDDTRVHPCSCTESPKCLTRWSALAALSLCLPCLCCYGPMQLGVKAATACYNCRKRGCNCDQS